MKKRIKIIRILIFVMAAVLLFRAFQIQILQGEQYFQKAENNRISVRPVSAPRGRIYSAEGDVLVSNRLAFDIYFMPNELGRAMSREELFARLAEILDIEKSRLEDNFREGQRLSRPGEGVVLKRNISTETMIEIQESSNRLPGIVIRESSMRDYVYGDFASHVLGYVGEIGLEDLQRLGGEGRDYQGGDIIGLTGLEREYEEYLRGDKGQEIIEINHRGHKESLLQEEEPEPGLDIQLNLEKGLQMSLEEMLQERFYEMEQEAEDDEELSPPKGASLILMDVNSGDVLGMSSYPDYNPNIFSHDLSTGKYQEIISNSQKPLLDRNTMISVPPGSVFKLITGVAGIEHLGLSGDTEFYDATGEFNLPGWETPFTNWLEYGEGEIDFTRAIARSNNIVFYEIGYDLYQEYQGSRLVETARNFGLGEKTGIDLPQENTGRVPDGEWKRDNRGEGWYPGDSINMAIGQGDIISTPVQLLQVTAAVANRGTIYAPRLVDKVGIPGGEDFKNINPHIQRELPYDERTFAAIETGMVDAVMEDYGTGSEGFEDFPVDVAGKTGTAQITGSVNHAWFVAYAPVEDPEVALVVFIQEGETSRNAVPLAADLLEVYLELNRQEGDEI